MWIQLYGEDTDYLVGRLNDYLLKNFVVITPLGCILYQTKNPNSNQYVGISLSYQNKKKVSATFHLIYCYLFYGHIKEEGKEVSTNICHQKICMNGKHFRVETFEMNRLMRMV
jgi:hypothetical protein